MLKIDLGGTGKGGEWFTVNLDPATNPDQVADIRAAAQGLDFLKPESVDEMRCIHTLEHIEYAEIVPTLAYWRTFLKPTGKLLIVVPNVAVLAGMAVNGELGFDAFVAVMYGNPAISATNPLQGHRWGFGVGTMVAAILEAGFEAWEYATRDDFPPSWEFDYAGFDEDHGKPIPNLRLWALNTAKVRD